MQNDAMLFSFRDIYATKGVEYLIVIVFFLVFAYFAKKFIMFEPWKRIRVLWVKPDKNK